MSDNWIGAQQSNLIIKRITMKKRKLDLKFIITMNIERKNTVNNDVESNATLLANASSSSTSPSAQSFGQ